jgi:hypothetical protein
MKESEGQLGTSEIPWPEDVPVLPLWPDGAEPFRVKRSRAFQLAQSGRFPCETLRIGGRWLVRTSDLRRALGLQVYKTAS